MKRILFATAILAALAIPPLAQSATTGSGNQTVTLVVNKAIETGAGSAAAVTAGNPSGAGGNSLTVTGTTGVKVLANSPYTATVKSTTAAANMTWDATLNSVGSGFTSANNVAGADSGSALATALQASADANSTPVTVPGSGSAASALTLSGNNGKRADNDTQDDFLTAYTQTVRWADQAGNYTTAVTYTLTTP